MMETTNKNKERRIARSFIRTTDDEYNEIKSLLKSIKQKSHKKGAEALIVSLRLFNNILDGDIRV